VTTRDTTGEAVEAVWRRCAVATLGAVAALDRDVDARAVELSLDEPRTQLAPTTRIVATAVAFQWRRMNAGSTKKE
jgi:hypothetical protein